MGRAPCCTKVGLRRGPWSIKEDTTLTNYIQQHGEGQWRALPKNAGLLRCGKSCRLRWMNYLRPGIKRGNISQDEEDLIVRLHGLLGNRWSLIAGRLPGRTDNEIKNYWNTHLIKKLQTEGVIIPPKHNNNNNKKNKDSSTPKIPKPKKSTTTSDRKKKLKKVNEPKLVPNKVSEEQKVYLPKPIRVSNVFSRSSSYDSLASSSEGGAVAADGSYVPVTWPEEELVGYEVGGFVMPMMENHGHSDSMSDDVNMWEKVYDEFFQLL